MIFIHSFFLAVILGNPLSSTSTVDTSDQTQLSTRLTSSSSIDTEDIHRTSSKSTRPSFRIAKAIGLYPQGIGMLDRQAITTFPSIQSEHGRSTVQANIRETSFELSFRENISNIDNVEPVSTTTLQRSTENIDRIRNSTMKKDSKITWTLTTNKSGKIKYDQENRTQLSDGPANRNVSLEEVEDLTVLPLQEETSKDEILNRTRSSFITSLSAVNDSSNAAIRTFNQSEENVEIDEEVSQTQHFATAASIIEGNFNS